MREALTTKFVRSRYARLMEWQEQWKRIAGDPAEALLGRSVPNLIDAAISALRNKNPSKTLRLTTPSWPAEVLRELKAAFDRRDPCLRLLSSDYPTDIAELRTRLQSGQGTVGDFSTPLRGLSPGPSMDTLETRLRAALARVDRPNEQTFYVISLLLFRRTLTMHAPGYLKEVPQKTLATACLELRLPGCVTRLAENQNLSQRITAFAHELGASSELLQQVTAVRERLALSLFDWFERLTWSRAIYQALREAAFGLLVSSAPAAGTPGQERSDSDATLSTRLGTGVMHQIISSAVAHLIDGALRQIQSGGRSASREDVRNMTGDVLRAEGFVDNRSRTPYRPTTIDALCDEAMGETVGHTVGDICALEIQGEQSASVGSAIGSVLGDALRAGFSSGAKLGAEPVERLQLVAEALAERRLLQTIEKLVGPVLESIFDRAILQQAIHRAFPVASWDSTKFWNSWAAQAKRRGGLYPDLFHHCPWDALSRSEFRSVLRALFSELGPRQDTWGVIGDIDGLRPQGAMWRIGRVTFYDPANFDFGEGTYFGRDRANDPASFRTGTYVIVEADSAQHAHRRAHEAVRTALDLQSIAVRPRTHEGSIDVTITEPATIINLSRKFWSGSWTSASGGSHPIRHALDDGLTKLPDDHPQLSALSGRPPSQLTDLEKRLLRAARRFREGNWATTSTARFLEYWIGLEQLFEQSDRSADIIKRAASFRVTWRDVEGLSLSPRWRSRMRARVRRDYPKAEEYGGPLREYDVVVKVNERGWNVNVTRSPDAHAVFRRYLDPPDTVGWDPVQGPRDLTPAIVQEVNYKRARARFALHRLYELRNEIVHEALPFRIDAEALAHELELILEDVLQKIIGLLEQPTPPPIAIGAAQVVLDRPWM